MENTIKSLSPLSLNNPENRMQTIHLVLLSIITLGIYNIIYLWFITPRLEEFINKKFYTKTMLYALTICIGIAGIFSLLETNFALEAATSYYDKKSFYNISMFFKLLFCLVSIASNVLYIIWAMKARTAIEQYTIEKNISFPMNKIMTFFFTIYYVNYLINQVFDRENFLINKQ